MGKITSGTKEWADKNINFTKGCSNGCRYCYAKKMAIRFKRIENEDKWEEIILDSKKIPKKFQKIPGRIMIPTSHDIIPENLELAIIIIDRLLKAGNNLLITTKPLPFIIKAICTEFYQYKNQIQFRFTITGFNKQIQFWEPHAPLFEERLDSLKIAYEAGFKTSVSIEPLLLNEWDDIQKLLDKIYLYCTESIWIGFMNHYSLNNPKTETERKFYNQIKELKNTHHFISIYEELIKYELYTHQNKIRLKDSIVNFLKKHFYCSSSDEMKEKTIQKLRKKESERNLFSYF